MHSQAEPGNESLPKVRNNQEFVDLVPANRLRLFDSYSNRQAWPCEFKRGTNGVPRLHFIYICQGAFSGLIRG